MKKMIITFIILFLVILLVVSVSLIENNKNLNNIQKENQEYEKYLQKQVYGTEVISLIHKATNQNEKNQIAKDENGYYIENKRNSIKIDLKMLDKGKTNTYQMETIQKVGIQGFIQNFNLITFQCVKIEYHTQTKKVSKLIFEQIEE